MKGLACEKEGMSVRQTQPSPSEGAGLSVVQLISSIKKCVDHCNKYKMANITKEPQVKNTFNVINFFFCFC